VTKSVNATWGIYVKSLDTSEELALDADRQMETMSTIKIPLMVEALQQIKDGKFALTDKYTLARDDIRPGTGIIQRLDPGAVLTVKDLLTLMIIVSDNTATDALYRMVGGPDAVNARMKTLGLTETRAMTIGKDWFAALQAAPSSEAFYRSKKTPFGLRRRARWAACSNDGARHAVDSLIRSHVQIMRGQLYRTRIPRYHGLPHPTQDRRLPAVRRRRACSKRRDGRSSSIFTGDHYGSGETLENAIGLVAKEVGDYFGYRR
jgi:beta-lactamase class A